MLPHIRNCEQNSGDCKQFSPKNHSRRTSFKYCSTPQFKKRHSLGNTRIPKNSPRSNRVEIAQMLEISPTAALPKSSSSDNSIMPSAKRDGSPLVKLVPKNADTKNPSTPTKLNPNSLVPYLTMKRQKTAAMLSYQARKSVSQMDFKEARRTANYQLVAHVPNALVPATSHLESPADVLTIKEPNLTKLLLQDAALLCTGTEAQVRFVVSGSESDSEPDVRIASMRILNTIMLHAWRRRREEVRMLTSQVEESKKNFVKNRNQLHVYNSLFSLEKRRNENLNEQLKLSYHENTQAKLAYDELKMKHEQLTRKLEQLVKAKENKEQEVDNLLQLLEKTRNDLFHITTQQREQQEELASIQRGFQTVDFEKKELSAQVDLLNIELSLKKDCIDHLSENIGVLAEQLTLAGTKLENYKCDREAHNHKLIELEEYKAKSAKLEQIIKKKDEELITLQKCLAETVGQRIKQCFLQRQSYQQATYRMLHFVAYYMLPGTPPPSMPYTSIPDAVSKLRNLFKTKFGGGNTNNRGVLIKSPGKSNGSNSLV